MIRSLQSLRGIFAICIFITHCGEFVGRSWLPSGGDFGVAFFFMLSGFVMTLGYGHKIRSEAFSYRLYISRRIIRFWPLHLLLLGICILMTFSRLSAVDYLHLIPNALLLQSWSPNPDVFFSGNAPSWALSDLIFFCAVLPPLLRLRFRRPALFFSLVTLAFAAYALCMTGVSSEHLLFLVYIFPPVRLLDFLLGVLLSELYTKATYRMHVGCAATNFIQPLSLLVVALASCLFLSVPEAFRLASWWWLPVALTIFTFALTDSRGLLGRLLSTRPAVLLGDISFAFYLLHVPVCLLLKRLFASDFSPASFLLLSFIISLALAWLLWRFFERPVSNALLRRLAPRNSKPFVSE